MKALGILYVVILFGLGAATIIGAAVNVMSNTTWYFYSGFSLWILVGISVLMIGALFERLARPRH